MDHNTAAENGRDFPPPQLNTMSDAVPQSAERSRTIPHDAEGHGSMPQHAETFGTMPQSAVGFRNVPQASEKTEHHTLIVRDVVRIFEDKGVSRSERTIVSWCQKNALGASKLDAFYDFGERRYYITPESVERAIQEELSKQNNAPHFVHKSPDVGNRKMTSDVAAHDIEIDSLKYQIRDLEIATRVKDAYIERLEKEQEAFKLEREGYVERLMESSRRIGEAETKLLQLGDGSFGQ